VHASSLDLGETSRAFGRDPTDRALELVHAPTELDIGQ
jgi:hypothetical protein